MSIMTRLAVLEAVREAADIALVDAFQARPAGEQQRVLDGILDGLIADGYLPPPQPGMSIAEVRRVDRTALRQWRDRWFTNPAWRAQHAAVVIPRTLAAIREAEPT